MDAKAKKAHFESILQSELIVSLGCTEPSMVVYATALAVETLEDFPKSIEIQASGNIIKNVKTVKIPHGGGLKGLRACAVLGAILRNSSKKLEILESLTCSQLEQAKLLLSQGLCQVLHLESEALLHLVIRVATEKHHATVEIKGNHLQVVYIEKDGHPIFQAAQEAEYVQKMPVTNHAEMSIKNICTYVDQHISPAVKSLIERQFTYNKAIAEEGLQHTYGLNVGSTLLGQKRGSQDLDTAVKAFAAAGSDARMAGCALPVVICCGSGNVGMTLSNSVYAFAEFCHAPHENIVRALVLADLITIHIKSKIGRLSSFCGPVAAACGVATAFLFLHDHKILLDRTSMAIKHVLSNVTGIICDGAKESCAAKIATCIDASLQSYYLVLGNKEVSHGCGVVDDDIEKTILDIGKIAKQGMCHTDRLILEVMTSKE